MDEEMKMAEELLMEIKMETRTGCRIIGNRLIILQAVRLITLPLTAMAMEFPTIKKITITMAGPISRNISIILILVMKTLKPSPSQSMI